MISTSESTTVITRQNNEPATPAALPTREPPSQTPTPTTTVTPTVTPTASVTETPPVTPPPTVTVTPSITQPKINMSICIVPYAAESPDTTVSKSVAYGSISYAVKISNSTGHNVEIPHFNVASGKRNTTIFTFSRPSGISKVETAASHGKTPIKLINNQWKIITFTTTANCNAGDKLNSTIGTTFDLAQFNVKDSANKPCLLYTSPSPRD